MALRLAHNRRHDECHGIADEGRFGVDQGHLHGEARHGPQSPGGDKTHHRAQAGSRPVKPSHERKGGVRRAVHQATDHAADGPVAGMEATAGAAEDAGSLTLDAQGLVLFGADGLDSAPLSPDTQDARPVSSLPMAKHHQLHRRKSDWDIPSRSQPR